MVLALLWLEFWFNHAYCSLVIKMCLLLFNAEWHKAYFDDIFVDGSSHRDSAASANEHQRT